jgi:hypothetical protein
MVVWMPNEHPDAVLVKSLDVKTLTNEEFSDVRNFYANGPLDISAIGRLEKAAKRQAEARDAEKRGLNSGI